MLEITYSDEKVGNLNRKNRNDNRNPEFKSIQMKINGKQTHIFKATEGEYMDSMSFPSGKVLR